MKKLERPPFEGKYKPLSQPIVHPPGSGSRGLPEWAEKISLLFDYYKIDRSVEPRWDVLALKLAVDYVPGFRFQGEPGRKTGAWNILALTYLNWEITQLQAEHPRYSIMDACRKLAKDRALHDRRGRPRTPKTLREKYRDSEKDKDVSDFIASLPP